jgi:hypothetical protein
MAQPHTDVLDAKRAAVEAKLAALRMAPDPEIADALRKADQAVNAYKAEAASLEAELDRIDGELQVRARDAREAAAQQHRDRTEANRQALGEEEARRLQAVTDAEAATRALVDAINRAIASNVRLGQLARELTPNAKAPPALNANGLAERFSGRISSVMATIKGHPLRLGFNGVEWKGGSLYPPDGSWRDDEARRYAADLRPLIEKGE